MKVLSDQRCTIGEGPIWNEREGKLYYTNGGGGNALCMYDPKTEAVQLRALPFGVAAYAFTKENELIVSHAGGVDILNPDNTLTPLYDKARYDIKYANDMKVGPDGRIYVGTQSSKRKGISEEIDGKLYSIDAGGNVRILLDGLRLSNGMEWSLDEKKFYHTDSDTGIIKEYFFDKASGDIEYTGREVRVPGVDGFTIGSDGCLYVGCWGQGQVAVVDTETLTVKSFIDIPAKIPTSCGFFGENMDLLAITTADYGSDLEKDPNAGFLLIEKMKIFGRLPYKFGD
jgi:sugar lactone lactonase YvrE